MIRLGIDVGGTFTDVVAVDAHTRKIVARVKVPTTHRGPGGVADGIVEGMRRVLADGQVRADEVAFIAHSTTQATNALLEGDVARVGVVGLERGIGGWFSRLQMRMHEIKLDADHALAPAFTFARVTDQQKARAAVDGFAAGGVEAVVVSDAFSVDRPEAEDALVAYARGRGIAATSGHEVSGMYGLRARTRTAVLNAAILPKMVRTARMTAAAVNDACITAPLMIMRSDGGVMDVREVERRPILTMLSGPAAGVAGALFHENVTDGIFIEVGGTSSDCSAIRNGMPQMRAARIGGHRTMVRTLDVRTLGVAGGSMIRLADGGVREVGPRSAHIAGMRYACFSDAAELASAKIELVAPSAGDRADYAVLRTRSGETIAPTVTCAANLLGYVPSDAFAFGNRDAARAAFEALERHLGMTAEDVARAALERASAHLVAVVEELLSDYGFEREQVVIVGGGGGAAALVPYVAEQTRLNFRLARDSEVISPIGVALALVRDVVERTIVDPAPEDIVRVRREAQDAVIAAGAAPDRVEVAIEIDPQRNLVRATASGATALVERAAGSALGDDERRVVAAGLLQAQPAAVDLPARTDALFVYQARASVRRFGRLRDIVALRVLDERGVARLGMQGANVTATTRGAAQQLLAEEIEAATAFGDVGRALPNCFLLHGGRIADFSGLADARQVLALAEEELAGLHDAAPVVILTAVKAA